jgi:acyl dehydratase
MAPHQDGDVIQPSHVLAGGPYFEDLSVGQTFDTAPALTITAGHAAVHQSIVGDRLALALDDPLARLVTGQAGFVSPALVWNVAIGQSTLVTQHVKANLFYRGLVLRRAPVIGDTLHTTTRVAGLRQNTARPGRAPTGLAALRITTVDQDDRAVLDFWRCAMIPLRDGSLETGHADDLDAIGATDVTHDVTAVTTGWDLDRLDRLLGSPRFADLAPGLVFDIAGGDVVSSAPELARLTLNIAAVHHDAPSAGGERLVYGGHTIALALSQASRALPSMATVLGWRSCDHLGPVHEGETLHSTVEVEQVDVLPLGGIAHLRSRVDSDDGPVLDWRYSALIA